MMKIASDHGEAVRGLRSCYQRVRASGPVAALAVMLSACSGILVEPTSHAADEVEPIKFWGYAINPGIVMRLEAQNLSGQWELLSSATSATAPTYGANRTGYYFEFTVNPASTPQRFRRPDGADYDVRYRVTNDNFGIAYARGGDLPSPAEFGLEYAFGSGLSDGVVQIEYR